MKSKKNLFLIFALIIFMVGAFFTPSPIVTFVSAMEGAGTEVSPYLIKTPTDLQSIDSDLDAYYRLENNIDMTGVNFTPLGKFSGTLDGNYNTISNLTINITSASNRNNVGLFSETSNAMIKNLAVVNANVYSTGSDVAILVGNDDGGTDISNTYVTGKVQAGAAIGGFFGSTHGSSNPATITNSYVRASFIRGSSVRDTSGFAGWNYPNSISITNSYSASIGEVRPLAGWSDGGEVNISRLQSTYYDNTLSASLTSGHTSLGRTSEQLKIQPTFVGWDFTTIWDISSAINGGYPFLRNFDTELIGSPGTLTISVVDEHSVQVENATVEIRNTLDDTERITLPHQIGGNYSNSVFSATSKTWGIYINGDAYGTITIPAGSAEAVIQSIQLSSTPPVFSGNLAITGDAIFGQVLNASLTNSNNAVIPTYQWQRDDVNIPSATGTSYTITQSDIGTRISVICTSTAPAGNISSAKTATVIKATQSAPSINMASNYVAATNNYTVSINSVAGAEYSFDNIAWGSNNEKTIDSDSEVVTGYIRMTETLTHSASPVSSATVTTGTNIADIELVNDAMTAVVNGTLTVPFGATQADRTLAVQNYVNGLLVGGIATVTATVSYDDASGNYLVEFEKGAVTDTKMLSMTVNESVDPDLVSVNDMVASIRSFSLPEIPQNLGLVSEAQLSAHVMSLYAPLLAADPTVSVAIVSDSLVLPTHGTATNPQGVDGMYSFQLEVSKDGVVQNISEELLLAATAYVGTGDPTTGDNTPLTMLFLLLILSAVGIIAILILRKRNKASNKEK